MQHICMYVCALAVVKVRKLCVHKAVGLIFYTCCLIKSARHVLSEPASVFGSWSAETRVCMK